MTCQLRIWRDPLYQCQRRSRQLLRYNLSPANYQYPAARNSGISLRAFAVGSFAK